MTNPRPLRGSLLLLDHCARFDRLTGGGGGRSARKRLEAELGGELARMLLGSLCGPGRRTTRL